MATTEVGDGGRTVCTVIGGRSCFVGRSLVSLLLRSSPQWTVRIADHWPSHNLDLAEMDNVMLVDSVENDRLSYSRIDVRDLDDVSLAIRGSSVVFVVDVSDSSAKGFYDWYMFIVKGMKNIIKACHQYKVERLVYNSSADVVFDGVHDISHGNESLPYPCKFKDGFYDLKVQAEAMVLSANGSGCLSTCVLRPCNSFGPADPYLIPSLISLVKSSWAQFLFGSGTNMSDYTYVDNVSHAHICAENALGRNKASVSGKAFFINNFQPVKSGDFASSMLGDLGFPCFRSSFRLPPRLVLFILTIFGRISENLGNSSKNIKFLANFFCTKTFDCSNAQKHIGYSPIVSLEDGIALTAELSSHLAMNSSRELDLTSFSKVESFLGSGIVSDILLWKNEKKSFFSALGMFLLLYWFLFSGRTLVSSMAELLFLASVILFGYCQLPSSLIGSKSEMISVSHFEVSETSVRTAVSWVLSMWNKGVCTMESISRGEDLTLLMKTTAALFLLKIVVQISPLLLFGTWLVGLFTVFIIYDQHESQVDVFIAKAITQAKKARSLLYGRRWNIS